jgi:hypothetical protein
VQGELDGRLLYGVRGYFTDWQGPFVRVGADGAAAHLYYSYTRLPLAEVGYEYMRGPLAFDAGVTSAYGTAGRFGLYQASSSDPGSSPMAGAFAWFAMSPAYARVDWQRVLGPVGTFPIDVVTTSGCGMHLFGSWPLMVCLGVGYIDRQAQVGAGEFVMTRALTGGFSIGLGQVGSGAQAAGAEVR